jgi:hypothetical protein
MDAISAIILSVVLTVSFLSLQPEQRIEINQKTDSTEQTVIICK